MVTSSDVRDYTQVKVHKGATTHVNFEEQRYIFKIRDF